MSRRHGEGGVVGLEALAFGVLVFVVGTLLVVNAWGVVDAKIASSSAAREATRVLVESGGDVSLQAVAERTADATLVGHGKDPARVRSVIVDGVLGRCERIAVTVTYETPTVTLPLIGAFGSGGVDVSGSHSEVVDPLRSGLAGEARCGF